MDYTVRRGGWSKSTNHISDCRWYLYPHYLAGTSDESRGNSPDLDEVSCDMKGIYLSTMSERNKVFR